MSEFFGKDNQGFNHEGDGKIGIATFAEAIQVWAVNQPDPLHVSVAAAAQAFNVSPLMVKEAVEDHYYMYLEGPADDFSKLMIQHEGE